MEIWQKHFLCCGVTVRVSQAKTQGIAHRFVLFAPLSGMGGAEV
jgi:hypothetical protein